MSGGHNIFGSRPILHLSIILGVVLAGSCGDLGDRDAPVDRLTPDAGLFREITLTDPYTAWQDFPQVDSVTAGTLNGSNAHRPLVRVRINAIAAITLVGDTLPAGTAFPDGATIVKSILDQSRTVVLAVMHKDSRNPLAGNGWLWAEFEPDGTVLFSIESRGENCAGCHAREHGGINDFVRTFERRH